MFGISNEIHATPLQASTGSSTDANQKKTKKLLRLHLQLFEHSVSCQEGCLSNNCKKMIDFIAHYELCDDRECELCRRISNLARFHFETCKNPECPVPYCTQRKIAIPFAGMFFDNYEPEE